MKKEKMGKRKGKPKAKTKEDREKQEEGEELPATSESTNRNCDDQRQFHKASNYRELARTFVSQKLGASGHGHETKLVRNLRSKSCKANWTSRGRDQSFERQLREKLEQVGASSDKPNLPVPPLISISIAPATAQASRSASCATTTNSTWSLKSIGKQREHLEEEDCEPPEQVEASEQLVSRLGSVSSCEVFAPSGRQEDADPQSPPTTTTSGLELVRKSYIRLVRHNSLQYFYLGTHVYSVICMILLPLLLLRTPPKQPPDGSNEANNCDNYDLSIENSETRTNIENKIASGGGGLKFFLISLASTLLLVAVIALKFFIELNRRSEPARQRQKQQQRAEYFDTPTNEQQLPRAQIKNTICQQQTGGPKLLCNITCQLPHYLQVLAIHLSLWLIVCPIVYLYNVTQDDDEQRRGDQPSGAGCSGQSGRASGGTHNSRPNIPIIMLSVVLYLLPHLMSEILTRPAGNYLKILLSTCLPIIIIILAREKLAEDYLSTLTMTVLASLAGQLRHAHLMALVRRDTFAGASDLIEAKVSLEQQRQQQETLLLSVLPAYVAEQVKRTMFKKMESVRGENDDGDDQHQQPPPGASLSQENANQQILVSTSNATTQTVGHGPTHCGRSLTLAGATTCTELQVQSEPLPNNGGGGTQLKVMLVSGARDQRHSFARASRLSSSLASGAAYISEALLNNVHPTGKSSSTTSSAVQVTSASQSQAAAAPTLLPALSNSLNTQQQSRRGFNELYIRTYNNVSLLYGDIVGFTRLCTQLSSSQLVRVLNNLFSHFDHLAERHRIMRIKILGDCYYGVSGIPEFAVTGAKSSCGSPAHRMHKMHPTTSSSLLDKGATSGPRKCGPPATTTPGTGKHAVGDNHAINCVNMGLDMIQYIKRVNIGVSRPSSSSSSQQQQPLSPSAALSEAAAATAVNQQLPDNFELNMRIGIHTGHIHSGVIGLKKWQFDVWSNDVSIAMHCESSGVAGRVQVTEATAQHLRGAFTLEPACTRTSRDTFLADRDINTYLIRERVQELQPNNCESTARATPTSLTASEVGEPTTALNQKHQHAAREIADEDRIREATIGTIRQTLLAGNGGAGGDDDSDLVGATPLSACGLAELEHNDIRWLGLTFRESTLNKHYEERQVRPGHHLFELLLLFFILALALHLIDYLTLVAHANQQNTKADHYFRLILLGSLLVSLCLLIVALPKPRLRRNGRSSFLGSSGRAPSLTQQQQQQQHNHKSSGSFMSSMSQSWSPNEGDLEDPLGGGTLSSRSSSSRLVKLLSELPMARKWCRAQHRRSPCLRAAATKPTRFIWLPNNRLTSSLVLLALVIAAISQAHLIAHYHNHLFCAEDGEQTAVTNELRQMTILIVLMALDLSPSLWTYRTRSFLLMGVITLQVACLASSNSTSGGFLSKIIKNYIFAYFQQQSLCPDSGEDNRDQPTGGHNDTDNHLRYLVDLASDILLLVVALWSLAYQRQLECVQRCNFLWRNRLNVDHEELEYISGINKVLLENILPSHVVQHYLAQPQVATQTTTSGSTKTQIIDNHQRQVANSGHKHKRAASEIVEKMAKSPSVASSASTQLVRMSIGCPMRGPLHSVGATADGMSELYHEQHDSVAVMFASIPHFYEFYDESDISKQGLGCIALLNEIICDFDKLLLKNKFSRIEKIKTIGSTYMAAAGLRPSGLAPGSPAGGGSNLLSARNSAVSQAGATNDAHLDELNKSAAQQQRLSQQKMNLICMIQFATSLMSALNGINKQSFQVFKLRVGVNAGPVIAGIIGAQRPFYDIWGDCVNIASRMESLGEVGRIQVEERTAKLLMECLCNENYVIRRRGPIDVKGKGGMVTYFVDKKELESCSRQSSASIAAVTASARQQLKQQEQQLVAQAANKQPSGACAAGQSDDAPPM